MTIRYIIRDKETQGVDFLVWGDDDAASAIVSLRQCRADGLDVEMVVTSPEDMDEHTRRLIGVDALGRTE